MNSMSLQSRGRMLITCPDQPGIVAAVSSFRVVLARAVSWHLEDRILVHGNKTVVFA